MTALTPLIPLVTRSYFSLMWGTCSPEALCRSARRLGYTRLAMTDTDNLYGLPAFLKASQRTGITPIIGAEITIPDTPMRIVCLVENNEGYKNLCRLITARKNLSDANTACTSLDRATHGLKSSLPHNPIEQARRIKQTKTSPTEVRTNGSHPKNASRSHSAIQWLIPYIRGLLFLTPHPELLTDLHKSGAQVFGSVPRKPAGCFNRVRETARHLGRPTVAVPGSFFLQPEEHNLHLLLRAIAGNTSISHLQAHDVAPNDAWLASPQEYQSRFEVFPEAIRNSYVLAERCSFTTPETGVTFPDADIPEAALNAPQGSPDSLAGAISADVPPYKQIQYQMLSRQTYIGAHQRYGSDLSEIVVERIEYELRSIAQKGFIDYFLIIQDIVQKSPRICGRGSGAASIVAYCLGITNVCPIKFNLYFERFLNPGRMDPPDIDIDFAWDERDDVLEKVFKQYEGRAAMVCNHVYFQPRMAIRETAKVFGIPECELGRVGEMFSWQTEDSYVGGPSGESFPFWSKRTRGGVEPQQYPVQADTSRTQQCIPSTLLELSQKLVGIPRHLSVHPGGVVITPGALNAYVPIETASKGVPIIHWEKDGAEQMGLVKIDLLGNRSLGVIRDTIANIKAHGTSFDEARWEPEDDALTQRIVGRGETMGCFYIESPGMRLLQQKTKKGDYEHLIIHSSIIRPAANEYIREYVRRVRGGAWKHFHPALADSLDETYGIMVYQEQVSQAAMALAGFSHSEADRLRKVLSKKDKEHQLADYKDRFFEGAQQRNVSRACLEKVWDMMMSFSGYSFCKPHSASYARVSFQAAYLKAHYPAAFMAAVISNQGGFYSTFAYVSEARRLGCKILRPDVQTSNLKWQGERHSIRVGFLSIKDLSHETIRRLCVEREKRPFAHMNDFLKRVVPDEREARALIRCGACNSLAPHTRLALRWELATWQHSRKRKHRRQTSSLFEDTPSAIVPAAASEVESETNESLCDEYATLGFLCHQHPIVLFKEQLERAALIKAIDLEQYTGQFVRIGGWLITGKVVSTKHGDLMEFLTFEDETGLVETTFFPKVYRRFKHLLVRAGPFFIQGKVEVDFDALTLTVSHVASVEGRVRIGH